MASSSSQGMPLLGGIAPIAHVVHEVPFTEEGAADEAPQQRESALAAAAAAWHAHTPQAMTFVEVLACQDMLMETEELVEQCMDCSLFQGSYLGSEVVEVLMWKIRKFTPPPQGNWGWLLRTCTDIGLLTLRQLLRTYFKEGDQRAFTRMALDVVRLYLEEAFRRVLVRTRDPLRKAAFCSLMLTMKNLEMISIPQSAGDMGDMGFFQTFTVTEVDSLAGKVRYLGHTRVMDCISYGKVMDSEMRMEAFSLYDVWTLPNAITMSHAEIVELIEAHGGHLGDDERTDGTEGRSIFAALFCDEAASNEAAGDEAASNEAAGAASNEAAGSWERCW